MNVPDLIYETVITATDDDTGTDSEVLDSHGATQAIVTLNVTDAPESATDSIEVDIKAVDPATGGTVSVDSPITDVNATGLSGETVSTLPRKFVVSALLVPGGTDTYSYTVSIQTIP